MLEEGSCAMEKKPPPRQLSVQSRTGSTPERKSEFSNKNNGRRRWKDNNVPGGRSVEPAQAPSKPSKWNRGNNDKRPRQRGYYGDRQREEVAEADDAVEVFSTNSRKGNANDLLRFHFSPREGASRSAGRWTGYRGGGHGRQRKTVRYNKEQFLQASCQFVVRDDGEYSQQAIDPDALVKWELVELVRIFSTEPVICPICLNEPVAGKITKCGHVYCWACMIRYLALGEKDYRKCPICYDAVKTDDLRSVQWVGVPDFKVGDTIEMKLMRKSKGSVYVCPSVDWADRHGVPHNMLDGDNTKFSKLLVASKEQIQTEVIEKEKVSLEVQHGEGEDMEKPFIAMAQELLKIREEILQAMKTVKEKPETETEKCKGHCDDIEKDAVVTTPEASFEETEVPRYTDAFEDEMESSYLSSSVSSQCEDTEVDPSMVSLDMPEAIFQLEGMESTNDEVSTPVAEVLPPLPSLGASGRERGDSESSLPCGSPVSPFPVLEKQPVSQVTISPEEVFDNLELPPETVEAMQQAKRVQASRTKDTYYFYQAASGQHIFLHSLNARCLQQEYGSLENSPETISANIVAIRRMFMTEDVRKRLRYLNHIPLTCEFHVVELTMKPPLVSKETLKMFRGEIEGLRRERQRVAREERHRARQQEVEHKKAHGIYPEVDLKLDSKQQFPSHLESSTSGGSPPGSADAEVTSDPFEHSSSTPHVPEDASTASHEGQANTGWGPQPGAARSPKNSPWESKSFAKIAGSGAWPSAPRWRSISESQSMPIICKSPQAEDSDGEGEGHAAPSYTASMAAAMDSLDIHRHSTADTVESSPGKGAGGKKKKKKEKQVLFSTSMARKN